MDDSWVEAERAAAEGSARGVLLQRKLIFSFLAQTVTLRTIQAVAPDILRP